MKSSFTYFVLPLAALLLTGCAAEESSAPTPKGDQSTSQETSAAEKTEEKQQETTSADTPFRRNCRGRNNGTDSGKRVDRLFRGQVVPRLYTH